MLTLFIVVTLGLMVVMAAAWDTQRRLRNAGWVDAFWSFGTGLGGVICATWPVGGVPPTARQCIAAALVSVWSLRLGLHIVERTPGRPEDVRYASFRSEWGPAYERNMFGLLMVQAVAAAVLDLSIMLGARNPAPGLGLHDLVAILVLIAAVYGGATADRQMQSFRSNAANRGQVCDQGLWAWSRHPNYFFEFLGWTAYPLLALNPAWIWGWFAWVGPGLMYVLLVYVSGIPPLEREMLRSRGERFRDYQNRVSAFFPSRPKAARG
jgi:steroid 5-alpha reductase family enzyme